MQLERNDLKNAKHLESPTELGGFGWLLLLYLFFLNLHTCYIQIFITVSSRRGPKYIFDKRQTSLTSLLQVNDFSSRCNEDHLQQMLLSLLVHKTCQNTKHARQRLKSLNTVIFQAAFPNKD